MISQDEQTAAFWYMLFKHPGFESYYYSIRSKETRQALCYLLIDIQLGSMEGGQRVRDLYYTELKQKRVMNVKYDLEISKVGFENEMAFVRALNRLVEMGVLIKYPITKPSKRKRKVENPKSNMCYRLNHELITKAAFEPGGSLSDYDRLLESMADVYQKLRISKEIGSAAFIALGRTAEDFEREYRERTARTSRGVLTNI